MVRVVHGHRQPISSLARDQKIALVREHGAVLFREFDVDTAAFRAVAEELGRNFYNMALDPRIRELVSPDGMVAGVIKGNRALPLHMERGYSPLKPELVLFHVVTPSQTGGESLLCNGTRVLDEFAPATLARFRAKRLKYRHTWEPEAWQGRYGRTPDEVARLFATIPEVVEFRFDGDLLHYSYLVSAIVSSRLGGREAFCNNLEGAWRVQHGTAATRPAIHDHAVMFDDDEPITEALVQEVHDAVARATEAHAIAAGDVFVIDNYRYMHGRAAFDGERVMQTIMADAAF